MKKFFSSVMKVGSIALLLGVVLIQSVQASTYTFSQTNWGGGINGSPAVHPTNLTNLTQYSSSTNAVVTATSTSLSTTPATSSDSFTTTVNKDVASTTATWDTTNGGNIISGTFATSLNSKISGIITDVSDMSYDVANGNVYLGSYTGQFAVYSIGNNSTTDLTSKISGVFAGASVTKMELGGSFLYLFGSGGQFVSYNVSTGVATNLTALLAPVTGYNYINDATYDAGHNYLYLSSLSKKFMKYDAGSGVLTDLTAKLPSYINPYLRGIKYYSPNNSVYMAGQYNWFDGKYSYSDGSIVKYDATVNTSTNLGIASGDYSVAALEVVGTDLYIGSLGNAYLYKFAIPSNTLTPISTGITTGTFAKIKYDSVNNLLYRVSVSSAESSILNLGTGATTTLTSYAAGNYQRALAVGNGITFMAGDAASFIKFDPLNNVTKSAYSTKLNTATQNIAYATVTSNNTVGSGSVAYYVSNNGGATYNQVTLGSKYTFATVGADLRWRIDVFNGASVQDITVNYGYYPASGEVISMSYNSNDTNNQIGSVGWNFASRPTGTDAMVSVRTSPDNSSWTAWQDFTTSTCSAGQMPQSTQFFTESSGGGYSAAGNEAGNRFTANYPVTITGLRYYNWSGVAAHTARIWDSNGVQLGSVSIGNSAGWNTATLSSPISIASGTTFTVSSNVQSAYLSVAVAQNTTRGALTVNKGYTAPTAGTYPTNLANSSGIIVAADPIYSYNLPTSYACTSIPGVLKTNSRYFQYKITASSTGAYTPVIDQVQVKYVINVAPNFDTTYNGTGVSATSSAGVVSVTYKVRDTDTDTGSLTPGLVTPSFEYSTDGGSNWNPIGSQYLGSGDTNNKTVTTSAYNTYIATWYAFNQLGSTYSANTQVRVSVNDNEASNNTSSAVASSFILDTAAPNSVLSLDMSAGLATVTVTDNSNIKYSMVNGTTSSPSYTNVGGISLSTTSVWTFDSTRSVTLSAVDTYGNTTTITGVAPDYIKNFKISGANLSWTSYSNVTGANFKQYDIYRSDNGAAYSLLASPTSVTGAYTDATQVNGHTYKYRIRVVDLEGDMSQWAYPNFMSLDVSAGTITYIFGSASNIQYRLSNGADASAADGLNARSGQWQSVGSNTTSGIMAWNFAASGNPTVTAEVLDAQSVDVSIVAAVPGQPQSFQVKDVSNQPIGLYQLFLSWAGYQNVANANLQYYEIWRGVNGATSTLYATTTQTQYLDSSLSNQPYAYQIRIVDTDGDKSAFSPSVSLTPSVSPLRVTVKPSAVATPSSAQVSWATSDNANGKVFYATSTALLVSTPSSSLDVATSTSHTVNISALTASTTYWYYVLSQDQYGQVASDTNSGLYYSFNTKPIFPTISSITTSTAPTSFTVHWTTNVPASSYVFYGTSQNLAGALSYGNDTATTTHNITVQNLNSNTTYYFYVKSTDVANQSITDNNGGSNYMIATQAAPIQINVKPSSQSVTYNSAQINWTTNVQANAAVFYATSTVGLSTSSASTSDASLSTNHSINLSGLNASTTYYYFVQSTDQFNQTATDNNTSTYYSFTTQPTLPIVTATSSTSTATSITVNWTTNLAANSQVYYGTSQDLSLAPSLGTGAFVTNHSVNIPGLLSNTQYWFYIKSIDALGRTVIDNNGGQNYQATTQPGSIQVMGNPQGAVATYNSAIVTWSTNVPANGAVFYSTATSTLVSSPSSSMSAATSTSHTVNLSGLNSSTTYYYYVQSQDQYGQVASDTNSGLYYSFMTKQVPLEIVHTTSTAQTFNQAVIEWDTNRAGLSQVFFGPNLINAPESFMGIFGTYSMQGGAYPYHFTATVTNLNASSTYYFYTQVTDSYGEVAKDDNSGGFYTLKTKPVLPIISGVSTSSTQTALTIRWTTNVPTDGVVMYGTSTSALSSSTVDGVTTSHTVNITGLTPSSTFVFSLRSVDGLNQVVTDDNSGQFYSINTKPYSFTISSVSAIPQDMQASITWDTNYDSDSHAYYSTTTSTESFVGVTGQTSFQGGQNGYRHTATISNLQPGQKYYFYVTSADQSNVVAKDDNSGNYYSFTTTNTAPPSISNISIPTITQNVVTITWQTNKPTTGAVSFGTSPGVYSTSSPDTTLAIDHVVTITGLNASTTYYYVINALDVAANTANSIEGNFTTHAPVISNVQIDTQSLTDTSVVITWNTTVNANATVYYSSDAGMAGSLTANTTSSDSTDHAVLVGGLTPGVKYYYFVQSNDGSTNYIDNNGSQYYTFTTTDTVPPVISNINIPIISTESAAIIWATDKMSDGLVEWGTIAGALASSSYSSNLVRNHIMTITGLNASTTYYYTVSSRTPISRTAKSDEQAFNTGSVKKDTVYLTQNPGGNSDKTPPTISGIDVNPINSFDATVNFGTSKDTVGFVSYGIDTNYGLVAGDDQYKSTHSIKIKGLTMGSNYHFMVTAIDAAGNKISSGDQTFSTKFFSEGEVTVDNAEQFQKDIEDAIASALPSIVPPFVEKPEVKDITENSATISWRTNVPSYSVVAYSPEEQYDSTKKDSYANKEVDLNNKVTAHEIKLTNLSPNVTYHFMAQSFRLPQVVGKGSDMTFVTSASKIQARVAEVKNSSFIVVWTTGEPTDSIVEYVNTKTGVTQRLTEAEKKTLHSITIENLAPGTTYKVSVSGYNAKGNLIQGADPISVNTSKDVTPPKITNFKIDSALVPNRTDRAQAILSWKTDEVASSVVYYDEGTGTTGDEMPKKKIEGGDNIVTDHTIIVPSLRPGSIYRFMVESTDQAGNKAQTPIRTVIIPRQAESIFDVIFKNFEDTFKFLRQAGQ